MFLALPWVTVGESVKSSNRLENEQNGLENGQKELNSHSISKQKKSNNFQTYRTVRDSLTVKNLNKKVLSSVDNLNDKCFFLLGGGGETFTGVSIVLSVVSLTVEALLFEVFAGLIVFEAWGMLKGAFDDPTVPSGKMYSTAFSVKQ